MTYNETDEARTPAPGRRSLRVRVAGDGHRVTQFELFFDLVFVFAMTQITGSIAEAHSGAGVVRGAVLLSLLWSAWCCYAWLGNQLHADAGLARFGMIVAMLAVFVVALAIPEAWNDAPGGLHSPTVLVVAYVVLRVVHESLYVVGSAGDDGLRRQLRLNLVGLVSGCTLLAIGAIASDDARPYIWGVALVVDWTVTYVTAMRGGGWRIQSLEHFVERYRLVVILALGESVIAVGTGASGTAVDWQLLVGAGLGVLAATALWWLYFDVSADAAEQALRRVDAARRVRAAIDAYTYVHFAMVLGIVVTAVGVEEVLANAGDDDSLGGFAGGCLFLGPALFIAGHVVSWLRLNGTFKRQRIIAAAALVALVPVAGAIEPLPALALLVGVLAVLVAYETRRYADVRAEVMRARQ